MIKLSNALPSAFLAICLIACNDQKQPKANPIDPATIPQWLQKCQSPSYLEREEAIAKLSTLEADHHAALEKQIMPLAKSDQWQIMSTALTVLSQIPSLSSDTQKFLLSKLDGALKNADPDLAFRVMACLKHKKAGLTSEAFKNTFNQYVKTGNRKQRILIYRLCTELSRDLFFIELALIANLEERIADMAQFEETHEILTALSFTGNSQSLKNFVLCKVASFISW